MGLLIENGDVPQSRLFAKLGITRESLKEDVQHLKEWMNKQPHLPAFRHVDIDKWLENQLIMSKNSLEKAKNSIERYCSVRSMCPELYTGCETLNEMYKLSFDQMSIGYLPGLTSRLHKVAIVRIESQEPEEYNFMWQLKRALCVSEWFLLKGQDFTGFHVVFDLENLRLGHLTKFHVSLLRALSLNSKAYPVSFSVITIINHPPFMEKLVALFKPFVSPKLFSRLYFVKNHEELKHSIAPTTLPSDYGGEGMTLKEESGVMAENLRSIKDYILECDKLRCDDSKRLIKDSQNFLDESIPGSFRKLCID